MRFKGVAPAVCLVTTAMVIAACGGGGGSSSGDAAKEGASARGPITFVTGKDNSGTLPFIADEWNKTHANEKVTIKQQSDQADQQLSDLEQHFQAKDPNYDVVSVDVVWTAEFAAKGWVVPLEGQYAIDTAPLLPATVKAATYNGKLYAAPFASDGGLLYYRTDLVKTAPTSWDELIKACAGKTSNTITGPKPGCYAGQFFKYEGLTVNAAEAINANGGEIVGADGKTPTVDSTQAAGGLDFLVNGFKQGYIPKEALGFKETESLNAFIAGQLVFMRNWPYAVAVANGKGSKVVGKYGIAPLPGPQGHGASSLGGHSVAISVYSKYKATAADFLKFLESDAVQRSNLTVGTLAPVTTALYSDPELVKKFTYLPTLLKSIETAVPRPITPFYPGVTQAIQTNAYAALQGSVDTKTALANMQAAIKSATAGG